jgi:ureidoacrylate peracid hydrolase
MIRASSISSKKRERITFRFVLSELGNEWTNSAVWTEFKDPQLLACAEDSWGAEFHEGLKPLPRDMIVTKHRYSAFIGTDLDMLLRARGVKSLLVTGVGTGMCVFHTLSVGFMLDYYITLVEDCCATTYGPQAHKEAVALIGNTMVGSLAPAKSSIFGQERFARPAKSIEFHRASALFRR